MIISEKEKLDVRTALQKSLESFLDFSLSFDSTGTNAETFHIFISHIHDLCRCIVNCEDAGMAEEEISEIIKPAYLLHGKSPFINRLQTWPRGYPGDFETIEYILASRNMVSSPSIEYFCEEYALKCLASQQHRNKTIYQSFKLMDAIFKNKNICAKILSVAANTCWDVRLIVDYIAARDFRLYINDSDSLALKKAKENLKAIKDKCFYLKENPLSLLKTLRDLGSFDLIMTGGLFDYLPDKCIVLLIKNFYEKFLNKDGSIVFTNIARGNPYRPWIQYLSNWKLIERSEQEITALIQKANIPLDAVNIKKEETGLTFIIEINKG
jgi:extracellular factor (EF) 3-hydroxypalmitic acid methyl ester biosynthesis protein